MSVAAPRLRLPGRRPRPAERTKLPARELLGIAVQGLRTRRLRASLSALGWARAAEAGKLRVASVGVGGKGSGDISQAARLGEVVAICDVDERSLNEKAHELTSAKKYFDYRKMLDELGKNIDAVTVSTPDHTHAPASIMAMKM